MPAYAQVANAFDAVLAEMAAVVDRVVSLIDWETILNELETESLGAHQAEKS